MTDAPILEASAPPEVHSISIRDVLQAIKAGMADFKRAPVFGLFFAAFYVVLGNLIYLQLDVLDQSYWIIPLGLGFPLLAPFLAVGLYEVSRRIETEQPLDWAQILGVVFSQKDRQFPSIAMVIIMIFMFWVFVAHLVFAIFMGLEPLTNITSNWQDALLNRNGITMLFVGTAVGAVLSFSLFSLTVVSLPMLLDREMDFITAMIFSVQSVLYNPVPMVAWGAVISIGMLVAMLPFFLGLFIILPVLGHATWHLYRRMMHFADQPG
ncbi:DUF2189 domain-containing protein [Aliiroseovarius sediminis]|uniref:DUF2189 domain-containing protein n=1 Tax=Aliiroseovarius sediminis TaxID=2925839 RepID=UPI001F59F42F|nr:DUF2189 domain-containing protein [Aliiroseovarius sediminis]MCI2393545.1 DUF2189 domain-containing protein [Aliiroseovarius sediminis]